MEIRKFRVGDEAALYRLFYHTIRKINIQDYSQAQVEAWAPDDIDPDFVARKYREIAPFVALIDDNIVGYADLQADGYIDHFFCHHRFQGMGVGRRLFKTLLQQALDSRISTLYSNVSVTARPFFEAMGFEVEKEQRVTIGEQQLKNFRMVRDNDWG